VKKGKSKEQESDSSDLSGAFTLLAVTPSIFDFLFI
jgi:hypothetical protein